MDRVSGSSSFGPHGLALNEENVTPTLEPYISDSARVSNFISLRRSALHIQVVCSQLFSLQEPAQQDRMGSLELGKSDQESLLLGVSPTVLCERGKLHSSLAL